MGHHCCTVILTVLLVLLGLVSHCCGNPVRQYQTSLSEDERQIVTQNVREEIVNLAAKILRSTLAGSYIGGDKRNAGTIDSLYNLPHLFDAGKR